MMTNFRTVVLRLSIAMSAALVLTGCTDRTDVVEPMSREPARNADLSIVGGPYLYWMNLDEMVGRGSVDGSDVNQAYLNGSSSIDVAVDFDYIYYVAGSSIERMGVSNGSPSEVMFPTFYEPTALTVDGSYIYWAAPESGQIGRTGLVSGGVNPSFISGAEWPMGVAVDRRYIYWTNNSTGEIGRANLDGSGVNQSFIVIGESQLNGIEVNGTHIYWTNGSAIGRANLDGTGVIEAFIAGPEDLYGLAIDANYIYWANHEAGTIGRAALDGSGANQNFITGAYGPKGVAVDPPPVPTNTQLPGIVGSPVTGTKTSSTRGSWTGAPTSYEYQWIRCDADGVTNCADIVGRTAARYNPVVADIGRTLRVRVIAVKGFGASDPALSAASPVVTFPVPLNIDPPVITPGGAPSPSDRLRATSKWQTWGQATTYARQWIRCDADGTSNCADMAGKVQASYSVRSADLGFTIRLRMTATNAKGNSAAVTSAPTGVVN